MNVVRSLRLVIAVLLIVSATVFAIGVAVERSQGDTHKETTTASSPVVPGEKAPEGSEAREQAERAKASAPAASAAADSDSGSSEDLLGVDTESIGLVIAVVALSLALAVAGMTVRSPLVLVAIALFALVAAAFDLREVFHQFDESRTGVAVLAVATCVLHVAVAALALVRILTERVAEPRIGAA